MSEERCPYCSFSPENDSDFCEKHRSRPSYDALAAENAKLRQFIYIWEHEGRLQTFGSRQQFRKEANILLDVATAVQPSGGRT